MDDLREKAAEELARLLWKPDEVCPTYDRGTPGDKVEARRKAMVIIATIAPVFEAEIEQLRAVLRYRPWRRK